MKRLPKVSGQDCIKALLKARFVKHRQHGSYVVLTRAQPFVQVVVPDHKELDRGTLRAIIRQAGLTVDNFIQLLESAD